MSKHVQPALIDCANQFVSRVIYIDLNHSDDISKEERGNIRQKLFKQMQQLGWYPRTGTNGKLFYKRDNSSNWRPEEEVQEAIRATKERYPHADFQFAVLRPVCVTNDLTDDNIGDLFAGLERE